MTKKLAKDKEWIVLWSEGMGKTYYHEIMAPTDLIALARTRTKFNITSYLNIRCMTPKAFNKSLPAREKERERVVEIMRTHINTCSLYESFEGGHNGYYNNIAQLLDSLTPNHSMEKR